MRRAETSRPSRSNDSMDFVRGFLRDPAGVGSVIPSSRLLERRIVRVMSASTAKVVIELGPGTGGTTRALLKAMPADSRLVCMEIDPGFADLVERIDDPRLVVHRGSAERIGSMLEERGIEAPDVVVSGIPFSTMPRSVADGIMRSIDASLAPGGCFVAYQFRAHVARIAEPVFGPAECDDLEAFNVPPMRVYRWRSRN